MAVLEDARSIGSNNDRAIDPSPTPPMENSDEKHDRGSASSLSSQTAGRNEHDELSAHSGVPSTANGEEEKDQEKDGVKDVELGHAISAVSENPPPVKVPRSKRRGLFARFTLLAEVEEPKHYARGTKWFITFVIALAAIAAPLGSTIIFPSLLQISTALNSTPTTTNLSVAFYMLAMAIFPLWWSSFSEILGRRTIYIVSFACFLLWNILSALSTNIAMFIIMRLLGGGAAASVQAVGAGTIADIWEVKERGRAMGIYYLGPLMGPLLAPIIGGVLADKLGWRSNLWALVIYGGVLLMLIFFALPETLKGRRLGWEEPVEEVEEPRATLTRTSSRQVAKRKVKNYIKWIKRAFLDPLKILLCLRYPAVAVTIYYAAITFACLYLLNISLQTTFAKAPYNFTIILLGLAYIPNSLGYIITSIFGGKWTDRIMRQAAERADRRDEKGKLVYRPEDRMGGPMWIAALLYPGALIWYGWTAEKGVIWPVPLIANFFFGVGSMLVFAMSTTMLTEFMPRKASSGVAANNFVRNIFSCIGTIVAEPLIDAIGDGWLFTGVALIALASGSMFWVMKKYGPRWRESMDARME